MRYSTLSEVLKGLKVFVQITGKRCITISSFKFLPVKRHCDPTNHSFIHLLIFSKCSILVRVVVDPQPIPRWEHTLDRNPGQFTKLVQLSACLWEMGGNGRTWRKLRVTQSHDQTRDPGVERQQKCPVYHCATLMPQQELLKSCLCQWCLILSGVAAGSGFVSTKQESQLIVEYLKAKIKHGS